MGARPQEAALPPRLTIRAALDLLGSLYPSTTDRDALLERWEPADERDTAIDHLYSDGSGGYKAVLDDGTKVRVSRSYAPEIRDRIV